MIAPLRVPAMRWAMCSGAALLVAASLAGCVVDSSPRRRNFEPPPPPPSRCAPQPDVSTPRVAIDRGKTLSATPGGGAGVFVTYAGEGKWGVAWTCDTNASSAACTFDMSFNVKNVKDFAVDPADATISRDAAGFVLHTVTSTEMDQLAFTTDPGAGVVLHVAINGCPLPSEVFFVSDEKLATAPTDPVEFVPNTP